MNKNIIKILLLTALFSISVSVYVSADTYKTEIEPNNSKEEVNDIVLSNSKEIVMINGHIDFDDSRDFYRIHIPKDCVLDFTAEYSADGEEGDDFISYLHWQLGIGFVNEMDSQHFQDEYKDISYKSQPGYVTGKQKETYYIPAGIYYCEMKTGAPAYTYKIKLDYRPVTLTNNTLDSTIPSLGISHTSWENAWTYELGKEVVGMRKVDSWWGVGDTYYGFNISEPGEYILTFESGDGNNWNWYATTSGDAQYAGYNLSHEEEEIKDYHDDYNYFDEDILIKGKIHPITFKTTGRFYLQIWAANLYRFRLEKKSDYDARTKTSAIRNPVTKADRRASVVKKPAKIKKLTLKNNKGSKRVYVSWKRVKGVYGYQVQYALNKKFTKSKKAVFSNGNSLRTKKLKKKTYYFRVRAYKLNGKKKVYGAWSTVKKVKIKK